MNIKGKNVTLRAIEREDLDLMRDMFNDEEIEQLVVGWAFPISRYQQQAWFENNIQNKNHLRLIIETDAGEALHLHCDKCGWTLEGRQRQAVFKNGRYHDLLLIGILAEDYRRMAATGRWWEETPAEG